MHRAFVKGFSLGFWRITLIGTNCPKLSPFILDLAFAKLETSDMVLGPTAIFGTIQLMYALGFSKDDIRAFYRNSVA